MDSGTESGLCSPAGGGNGCGVLGGSVAVLMFLECVLYKICQA